MIEQTRNTVRRGMHQIAKLLNSLTGGRLHPNTVTITGLLLHFVVAWAIVNGDYVLAGLMLAVFGLLDALDGELARLQNRANPGGMLLDATTDRAKEIIIYAALAYVLVDAEGAIGAVWAIMALGGSFLVSYSKAKGETALSGESGRSKLSPNEANRVFQDGLMRFEVRMLVLVVGLLSGFLLEATMVVAILSWPTAVWRVATISAKLSS